MTDKKFTDEEIIKALEQEIHLAEYVDSDYCCNTEVSLLKFTLDLINRQKAEIERLKECPKCVYEYDGEVTEYCVQGPCSNFKTVEQIKTEAYKDFAENAVIRLTDNYHSEYAHWIDDTIYNLLKEMVGAEKALEGRKSLTPSQNLEPKEL